MGSLRASISLPGAVVSSPRVAIRKESLSVVVPQAGENEFLEPGCMPVTYNWAELHILLGFQWSVVRVPAQLSGGFATSKRGPLIAEIPLEYIRRPLLRTRNNDPEKVKELMESIAEIGLQEPIDVLEVEGVYYGFSGCHRYEAHQKLGLPTIKCKIRRGTRETLRHHLR